MVYKIKILRIERITHDVKRFTVEKPDGYKFIPGQATLVSINLDGWRGEKRPFTLTSLNKDKFLEFTIKEYKHKGVTEKLHTLKPGEELIIREPFGSINYKDKGVFITGGAGITPFIAILRQLKQDGKLSGNRLIFSNKEKIDIILEKEFKNMFKDDLKNLIFILTREKRKGYEYGEIDEGFLKKYIKNFKQNFYICGPPEFVYDIKKSLRKLGAEKANIVIEKDF